MYNKISLFIIYFFFYSNAGWFFESLYCSVPAKKWINRGFLTGPLCPIYGTGAIVLALLLSPFKDKWYLVFFLGLILCDIVEFITSVLLEKLFHARWWDYSHKFMNLQGRICLQHSIIWGFASLLFVKVIHPFFSQSFEKIPQFYINILLAIILPVFVIDLIGAITAATDIRKLNLKLQALKNNFVKASANMRSSFGEVTDAMQKSLTKQGKKLIDWTHDINEQLDEIKEEFDDIKTGDGKKRPRTARMFKASKNLKLSITATFKSIEESLSDLIKGTKEGHDKDK